MQASLRQRLIAEEWGGAPDRLLPARMARSVWSPSKPESTNVASDAKGAHIRNDPALIARVVAIGEHEPPAPSFSIMSTSRIAKMQRNTATE
jgi:hypothetical protein